eukprot:gene9315-5039_t
MPRLRRLALEVRDERLPKEKPHMPQALATSWVDAAVLQAKTRGGYAPQGRLLGKQRWAIRAMRAAGWRHFPCRPEGLCKLCPHTAAAPAPAPWPGHVLTECAGTAVCRKEFGAIAEKWAKAGHGEFNSWLPGGAPSKKHLVAVLLGIVTPLRMRGETKQQIALATELARAAANCAITYLDKCPRGEHSFEPEHSENHPSARPRARTTQADRKQQTQPAKDAAPQGAGAAANGDGTPKPKRRRPAAAAAAAAAPPQAGRPAAEQPGKAQKAAPPRGREAKAQQRKAKRGER